ncbi:DNA starvation/stationary phase protection protein DpsA [Halosegnis marinus]|uniref:DNA starvation/stationary phase protection protein DpsA n=1 Tax=Halosegnis marinus TaxID=3034023 RepID=A0ABD5ZRV0_9EURY|nr:DNA starvation/stationary phase protection protein DpsA [Halosegnis sp. DT85]
MSTHEEQLRQRSGEIEENALRLDEGKAEQVVDALNTDLAAAYVAYHQVKKHHWNVEGSEFRDIHVYLGEVAADLEAAADEFAERAQALGGVPLSGGAAFEDHAPVEPEGEDVYDIRTSLAHDMAMFGDVIETLRDHIALVEGFGDYTTGETLRRNLETMEEHAHHFQHYLEDDTLVTEESLR